MTPLLYKQDYVTVPVECEAVQQCHLEASEQSLVEGLSYLLEIKHQKRNFKICTTVFKSGLLPNYLGLDLSLQSVYRAINAQLWLSGDSVVALLHIPSTQSEIVCYWANMISSPFPNTTLAHSSLIVSIRDKSSREAAMLVCWSKNKQMFNGTCEEMYFQVAELRKTFTESFLKVFLSGQKTDRKGKLV